jgi:hypothetical protein
MCLKVPIDIVMSEDVRVGVWDEEGQDWHEDGITDLQYIEETRTLQFYITTVGTIALLKSRVADMPYKQWTMGPSLNLALGAELLKMGGSELQQDPALYVAPSSVYPALYERQARLTLETQKIEVVIDVVHSLCRLVKPDTPAFEVGKEFYSRHIHTEHPFVPLFDLSLIFLSSSPSKLRSMTTQHLLTPLSPSP